MPVSNVDVRVGIVDVLGVDSKRRDDKFVVWDQVQHFGIPIFEQNFHDVTHWLFASPWGIDSGSEVVYSQDSNIRLVRYSDGKNVTSC